MKVKEAKEILAKLTGMYNKTLSDYQADAWLEELFKIDEPPAQRVLKNIKSNPYHVSLMPTIPQFLALYRTYITKNVTVTNEEYCYVCCNKGLDKHIKELHGYLGDDKPPYILINLLYCDSCEKGRSMSDGIEPISKYFDVTKVAEHNKNRLANVDIRRKKHKNDVKVVARLWSMDF